MKQETRRSQRVADLVRSELSLLVLTEAHDPELRKVTITDVEMPPDLRSAHVFFSCLGGDEERAKAADAPAPRRRIPAAGGRPALPAPLRARAPLHARPLPRAGRPDRGAPPAGPAAGRRPARRRHRIVTAPDPLKQGLPLPPRQAREADLARRRRAGSRRHRRLPHRPQRHARPHGHGPPAPLRRRRRTPPELLHADGQVVRGRHPPRPGDDDLRPRGRARRRRPRRLGRDARGGRSGPPKHSAESSSRRRRRIRRRRSADGSSTRWRAGRERALAARRRSACRSWSSERSEAGRLAFSIACSSGTYIRSIASELGEKLGCGAHLESLRRTRIGVFSASDAVTARAFESMTPRRAARGAPRRPPGPGAFPVPPRPARIAGGLEDPPGPVRPGPRGPRPGGRLGDPRRPDQRHAGPGPGQPDRGPGRRPDQAEDRAGVTGWRLG